jgi:hypothetical protein
MLRGLAHEFTNGRDAQAKECSDLGIDLGARPLHAATDARFGWLHGSKGSGLSS